jgi:hypothetical protein
MALILFSFSSVSTLCFILSCLYFLNAFYQMMLSFTFKSIQIILIQ